MSALETVFETPIWEAVALVLGLIVGSFANVCIHRLPLDQSVVTPPSRCPSCGRLIRFFDNVPLLSWVVLGGRCRGCGAPISVRYPLVEAANGLLYLAVAWRSGPTWRAGVEMAFLTALLVLGLIDLDHQILPDVITKPGIGVGLAASFLPGSPKPLNALGAAVGGYLALFLVARAYRWARGIEGLGQGDWKMTALIGAFLGGEKMLLTVLVASSLGTLVGLALMAFQGRGSRHRLPLGTFLALGAALVLFLGDPVLSWYRGFLHG